MGSIGGLMGTAGGAGGTGFNTPSGTDSGQLQSSYAGVQNSMEGQDALLKALQSQNGLQNQSNVYNQMQGVVAGQGPNPAQAMLNQSTGQNVANQAALMAGQRGAGANVGLMARQNAMQGANLQQKAAGQGATMQAQQSLNALTGAGNLANTMASNQIGQTNSNASSRQNEQGILQGANTANNNIQGQLANTQLQGQQAMLGGLMQGIGSAAGSMGGMMGGAKGGEVKGYDLGGAIEPPPNESTAPVPVTEGPEPEPQEAQMQAPEMPTPVLKQESGPQSMFAQTINSAAQAQGPMPIYSSSNPGAEALSKGMASMVSGGKSDKSGGGGSGLGSLMSLAAMAAHGGSVGKPLQGGGHVPGKPKVKGNSYKNDTVKALLSPGEVVIPNSVMQSKDPAKGAARFVQAVLAKKKGRK